MKTPLSNIKWFSAVLVFFLVLSLSCRNHGVQPTSPNEPIPSDSNIQFTAEDSLEAYEIALWYSNQLTPSDSLIDDVMQSLKVIRVAYGDSIKSDSDRILLNYRFEPSWIRGLIHIRVDDTTYSSISAATYQGWSLLDSAFRPTEIYVHAYFNTVFIHFNPLYHPMRVAEIYRSLPGVTYTEARNCDYIDYAYIPIYPGRCDNHWSFVFHRNRIFYYFKVIDLVPHYLGLYDETLSAIPPWFDEAQQNNISIWCSWSQ